MSNLSELLPAGAGAKSADLVASGTLPSGQTVVLNSNGTVTAVSGTSNPVSLGGETAFNTVLDGGILGVYDQGSGKILFFVQDGGVSYISCFTGTISGTSISFGTQVYINSNAYNQSVRALYVPSAGKVVACVIQSSGTVILYLLTVSGTSVSIQTTLSSGFNTGYYQVSFAYAQGKLACVYRDQTTNVVARQVTVTSTTLTGGGDINIPNTTNANESYCAIAHEQDDKVIVLYKDTNNKPSAVALTVSGNAYSAGSATVLRDATDIRGYFTASYDSVNKKIIGVISNASSINYAVAIDSSSGTITNGSFYQISAVSSTQTMNLPAAVGFHIPSKKTLVFQYYSTGVQAGVFPLNVSGLVITGDSPTLGIGLGDVPSAVGAAVNSVTSSMGILWRNGNNGDKPTGQVFSPAYLSTNLTDTNFIGITDQAIADTATGAVIVQGGVSDKVTGLTTGSDYYVQYNGTLSTTVSSVPAGRALSSTSILLEG
jgi:hypothetical protein